MQISIIRHSIRNRGGDKLTLDYVNYLVGSGNSVEYWTNEISTHLYIDPRIVIKKIPIPGIIGTVIFSIIKKFKAEVVIVDLVLIACLCYIRNRKKIFYVAADYDVKYYKSDLIAGFIDRCYKLAFQFLNIRSVAVSDGLYTVLQKYKPDNLSVISNGVDLNVFRKDIKSPYYKQKKCKFVILLFAREDHRKGLDIGIKALEELSRTRDKRDWEVWVLGEVKINFSGNIKYRLLGFIKTEDELKDILSVTDIYLIPSRSEGLSFLLLQAMACECAIVSTTVAHILENKVNGLVSPVEDWKSLAANMNMLLDDDIMRSNLQKNSRMLSEEFSLQKSCIEFSDALKSYAAK